MNNQVFRLLRKRKQVKIEIFLRQVISLMRVNCNGAQVWKKNDLYPFKDISRIFVARLLCPAQELKLLWDKFCKSGCPGRLKER
jgi:hypothetical protein